MTIIEGRLEVLERLILDGGSHTPADLLQKWERAACVMEAASYLAGEPWSDSPQCVSPVLTSFGIRLNDSLPEDKRQLLKPFIPDLIGTRDDGHDEARRDLARQWLMGEWLPKWLRLANLEDLAVKAEQSVNLTGLELRTACRSISDLTWTARQDWRNKLAKAVEAELVKRGFNADAVAVAVVAADVAAAAVAVAAADVAAVAVADVAADVAADAAVAADVAAVAAAAADAVAAVAADVAAVAAADVAAAAAAAADADAKKLGYNDLYWPIRRALEKHCNESDTFIQVRELRDAQLESAVELFGRMARIGRAS